MAGIRGSLESAAHPRWGFDHVRWWRRCTAASVKLRVTVGEGQTAPPAGPLPRAEGEDGTHSRAEAPAAAARLRYLPGLDGLRALAVLAVLVYHADVAWLPGGSLESTSSSSSAVT